jgi:hypothetical protein
MARAILSDARRGRNTAREGVRARATGMHNNDVMRRDWHPLRVLDTFHARRHGGAGGHG